MTKLNNVVLTVCDVMGWQKEDVYALNIWLEAYANLLGSNQEEKSIRCVRNALALECGFPADDINQWFHTVISLIFYDLLHILKQHKVTKATLKKLEKSFSPNINFAASSFNNDFDAIDFKQERDFIIAQALALVS